MTHCHCQGIDKVFNSDLARKEVLNYRRHGPRKTTRLLIDALRSENVAGKTLLDIGGGIGVLQVELLESGVRHATGVEAASAYLHTARKELSLHGFNDRVDYVYGDFVEVAHKVRAADIVTLDRVLCCYPDFRALIDASTSRARTLYGLVYPRDGWLMSVGLSLINAFYRIRRSQMQFFLHPTREVHEAIRRHGFELLKYHKTIKWQVAVYRRNGAQTPPSK